MTVDTLLNESLSLGLQERAGLIQRLLLSLDELSSSEIERLWLDEAESRLKAFDGGQVQSSTAEAVFAHARAAIHS